MILSKATPLMKVRNGIFVCLLYIHALANAQVADSLEKILPAAKGEDRLKILSDLTWEYLFTDVKKAVVYAEEAYTITTNEDDSAHIAMACNDLAAVRYAQSNLSDALALNKRALRIRTSLGDKKGVGGSYNKITHVFIDRVQLDSAIFYALNALRIFEELADSNSIALSLNTLGNLYLKERDFEQSIKFSLQGHAICERLGNKYGLMGSAGNISAAYQELNKLDEAIVWNKKALDLATELDHKAEQAAATNNLGFIHRMKGDLNLALEYYLKADSIAAANSDSHGMAHCKTNAGGLLNDLGKPNEAIKLFNKSLEISTREKLGRITMLNYDGLSEANEKLGNFQLALSYIRMKESLKDSLYNEEKSMQMGELQTKYNTEKKEKENQQLRHENEVSKLSSQRNRIMFLSSVLVSLLLVVSGIFYYRAYKRRQENRMSAELLQEKERGIKAVFDATEEERKRIAKDLHDGIGQQLSAIKLGFEGVMKNVREVAPTEAGRIGQLGKIVDDTATEVRTISHQMMPKALQERGLMPAIDEMLKKTLSPTSIHYSFEHFQVENMRYNERVEVGIYRIAQELINNIIKHSGASEVMVQLFRNKNHLILVVEDNGTGFKPGSKQDGIGLMNISSRLGTVNGDVVWEPSPQSGTVATVRVPVA